MAAQSAGVSTSGKRERILAAAEMCFAEAGFFGAKIADIANAAGVADGTIYLYFRNKDDLLISWFEWRMEEVVARLAAAVADAAGSAETKLTAFVRAYLTLTSENPAAAEVLTVELRQSSKFIKEYKNPRFADFLKLLSGVIEEGQKRGELSRAVPPAHAARIIFGALDELARSWLLGGGQKFDIVRAADWVVSMTLSGLVQQKRSTP